MLLEEVLAHSLNFYQRTFWPCYRDRREFAVGDIVSSALYQNPSLCLLQADYFAPDTLIFEGKGYETTDGVSAACKSGVIKLLDLV